MVKAGKHMFGRDGKGRGLLYEYRKDKERARSGRILLIRDAQPYFLPDLHGESRSTVNSNGSKVCFSIAARSAKGRNYSVKSGRFREPEFH